jgi:hypothetical protein
MSQQQTHTALKESNTQVRAVYQLHKKNACITTNQR